jgi:hypothetical protein
MKETAMTLHTKIDGDAARAIGPLPEGHPAVQDKKIGVLLVNLGTPDGTDYSSMRRYLKEFLSDPRVIELNKAIWYPILYGAVLTTRPSKSGANYKKIWNTEKDESPLRTITRAQAEKLAAALSDDGRVDRQRGRQSDEGGLRQDRDVPALSAVFGDDDGDRQRPALPRADEDPPHADGALGPALS